MRSFVSRIIDTKRNSGIDKEVKRAKYSELKVLDTLGAKVRA